MGTDRVKLFDKVLGDRILAMDQDELTGFLEENSDVLSQKTYWGFMAYGAEGTSVSATVKELLETDYTLSGLRSAVVRDFACGDEEILIDYWGCYAHLFVGNPAGSISSLDYLQDEEEETFLLLRAEHVEQMVNSLRQHSDDLSVMNETTIAKLDEWRALCATNPRYLVAYLFDF